MTAQKSINISNMRDCIDDVVTAALDSDVGPKEPTDYDLLLRRLEPCREKLPPLYREAVFEPFVRSLREMGIDNFRSTLDQDRDRENTAGVMMDVAQAILQNGENYCENATDGFQEVITDLYDGFLSAEDRRGVKPPDKSVIPPLVKWGCAELGPYTWPIEAMRPFKLGASVVSLPPANARQGLLAWSALGHETAGHDILSADTGLQPELQHALHAALKNASGSTGKHISKLASYWADRIDETASDVMGILNMGPSAAIGTIGYFRGLNKAAGSSAKLTNDGPEDDPHPADIVRGFLAAAVVKKLSFSDAALWAKLIEDETKKDVSTITLEGHVISMQVARDSAGIVADTLVDMPLKNLENHALGSIQDWRNPDETIVADLRKIFTTTTPASPKLTSGMYAAHAVAAGVTAALEGKATVAQIFNRMLATLKTMHDTNPAWGPLYVVNRGSMVKRRFRV